MKKLLFLLLVVGLFLVGCGNKEGLAVNTDPNAPVTLTLWCWDPLFNVYSAKVAADIYKRDHPNVTINIEEVASDVIQQRTIAAVASGQERNLADIILVNDSAMQKNLITFPGIFVPLNDKIDLSQFAKYKVGFSEYEGKNYAVPFDNAATGTFLRTDLIEKAGLTVADFTNITWEHFFELAQIVKEKTGLAMLSYDVSNPDFMLICLLSTGSWLFDDQGNAYIQNNPVLKRAMELYIEGVKNGTIIMASDWVNYLSTINSSKVATAVNGAWMVGSITAAKDQAGHWALTTTPRLSGFNSVNYSNSGGSSWVVSSASKNQEVAIDFLSQTFAGSVELYDTILPKSGAIATWLPAGHSAVYTEPQAFFGGQAIFEDFLNYATHIPSINFGVFSYEARDAISRNMPAVVNGTMTIDEALAIAQKEVDFIIASAH